MRTSPSQTKTMVEMQKEARKLRKEFEEYVEDLRLFSNPKFWKAVREVQHGKLKHYLSLNKYKNALG